MYTKGNYKFNIETLAFEKVSVQAGWKRIAFKLIIIVALAYFIIGILLVRFNLIQKDDFLAIAAIVGGIASVSGLFTFSTSKLRRSDFEEIGIEYFKELIKSADLLKEKENDILQKESLLSAKEKELQKLELDRAELEFVVRKASMSIFLQDQYERLEDRIVEIVQANKELVNLLGQREQLKNQLSELGEELKSDDRSNAVAQIIELIQSSKTPEKNEKTLFSLIRDVLLVLAR